MKPQKLFKQYVKNLSKRPIILNDQNRQKMIRTKSNKKRLMFFYRGYRRSWWSYFIKIKIRFISEKYIRKCNKKNIN